MYRCIDVQMYGCIDCIDVAPLYVWMYRCILKKKVNTMDLSLEEDDEAREREREIRQNIIVMMIKKFDLLYRLNKTLFQRIAIFLKPVRFLI